MIKGNIFKILYFLFLLIGCKVQAQIDPNSLLGLVPASETEMNSIVPTLGSLIYNTTDNQVYVFNGSEFIKLITGPQVYVGSFSISSTGSITITGVPFEPSIVTFSAYANVESSNINDDNETGFNNTNTLANAFGGMRGYARDDGNSISEQVIYVGGHGNSINDISRYASSSHSIGVRYNNQNGDFLGLTSATVSSFNVDGFTLNVDSYADGLLVIFEAKR